MTISLVHSDETDSISTLTQLTAYKLAGCETSVYPIVSVLFFFSFVVWVLLVVFPGDELRLGRESTRGGVGGSSVMGDSGL